MRFAKSLGLGMAAFVSMGSTSIIPTFAATPNQSTEPKYVVQGNDTFWSIARKLNVRLPSLLAANPSTNPMNLYPGLLIQLPMVPTRNAPASSLPSQTASHIASRVVHNGPVAARSVSKVISCVATAYSASPAENAWGSVDYFGNPLKLGTIAVDPSVIPLGSTAYITGYTFHGLPQPGMLVHATDEGSAIQGHRVDIFVPGGPANASQFGFQNVKVHLLR